MRKMKLSTVLLVLLLVLFVVVTPGCYGKFNLTRQIYNWNTQIGTKWVNEVVFVVFLIVPIYEVTLLVDSLIFNSIEFWGGTNPVNEPTMEAKGPQEIE